MSYYLGRRRRLASPWSTHLPVVLCPAKCLIHFMMTPINQLIQLAPIILQSQCGQILQYFFVLTIDESGCPPEPLPRFSTLASCSQVPIARVVSEMLESR